MILKTNSKTIAIVGLLLAPGIAYSEFPKSSNNNPDDTIMSIPQCESEGSFDYKVRLRKDSDLRLVLDYFVCVYSKSKIKDVEYYINNVLAWSISIDSPEFGMVNYATFSHGIILESIKDFKKGVHEAKVILYNENNIESRIRSFKLDEDIKSKPYAPFTSVSF